MGVLYACYHHNAVIIAFIILTNASLVMLNLEQCLVCDAECKEQLNSHGDKVQYLLV